MLINILFLCLGVAVTFLWLKLVKPKVSLNYLAFAKDKSWLLVTGLIIVSVSYLYFYLPQVFRWVAVDVWGIPTSTVGEDGKSKLLELTDLGSLGDIYGSLNTLFTSATLAFVVYATLLQREANKDARKAMSEQLQQAKDSTEQQLQQANNASNLQLQQAKDALEAQLNQVKNLTEQQITNANELANIQIEQARTSTEQQLALAKATHDAQMKEPKYSIFSNIFYTLLNQKHSRYLSLQTSHGGTQYVAQAIFHHLSIKMFEFLRKNSTNFSLEKEDVKTAYFLAIQEISGVSNYAELFSYFNIIVDLYDLINRSELDKDEKDFFKKLLANSLTSGENSALFWIGAFRANLACVIKTEKIFNLGYYEIMMPFAVTFYNKESFYNLDIHANWDNYINKKTPA